jgi:hypothetical protein
MGNAEIRLQRRSAVTGTNAAHNGPPTRIAAHQKAALGVIPGKQGWRPRHPISRRGAPTTQTETGRHSSRHEIAIFESGAPLPRFVVRGAENPT